MSLRPISGLPGVVPFTPDVALPEAGNDEKAARAFESYFGEMLVREMQRTLPDGFLAGDPTGILTTLVERAMGDALAAGGGIGVGDLLQSNLAVEADLSANEQVPGQAPLPSPVEGTVTSGFGWRVHPILGDWRMHRGIDIGASEGTPIRPIAAGTVTAVEERSGYGRVVEIDHGGGWTSLYAHCDRMDVRLGERVLPSTTIATVGNTGLSTGPHLHLEVHQDGEPVDPAGVLEQVNPVAGVAPEKIRRGRS